MALFGKKNNAKTAAPEPAANAPVDDFSPEALAALAASMESETGETGSPSQVRRPVAFKNGSMLGLNIGTETIKVVELTAKNGVCSITGIGIAPTPSDSISNGVVLSVNLLGEAIRELLTNSGIKNRRVVTSVAGTGEVIVRVIEVPTMSDAELAENIKTDIDRYIPFPPSEVQWDAASMRSLPTDPNATNMDVLLVAARHELIDLHLELLESIKLDPRAIDVEPLAAARAIAGPISADAAVVDYDDVCAILDIGANSTDISILRGNELVFTRTLPVAGNMMTQKMMDEFGLPRDDAERMKRELADALPIAAAPSSQATDDFFSGESDEDVFSIDEEPIVPEAGETQSIPADTGTETTADPFDLDFFNQGSQSEPDEQHQQKMPGDDTADDNASSDALPSFAPEEKPIEDIEDEDASLPSRADDTATPATAQPAAGGAISSFFDFNEDELDPHSEQLPTIQGQPQHTEAPPREEEPDYISEDDDSFLPSIASSNEPGTPLPSAFAFPGDDSDETPAAPTETPSSPASTAPVSEPAAESTFAPLSFESVDAPEAAPAEEISFADAFEMAGSPESPEVEDEIDLSDILGDDPTEQPAIDIIDEGLGSSIDVSEEPGLGTLTDDLSAGLEIEEKPQDEQSVNNVLQPLLEDLTNELRRSLEYHSARYPNSPVTRLVLIGGGAKLRNLDAYFAQNLGIPTSIGNPLAQLTLEAPQTDPRLIEEHGHSFAIALGLALREIIK